MHCPSPFLHLPQTLFIYLFYFLPRLIYFPAHLISFLPGSLPANYLIPALLPSPSLFTCRGRVNGDALGALARSQAELSDAWPWLALSPRPRLQGVSPECKGERILTLWDRVMRWTGVPRLSPDRLGYQSKSLLVKIYQVRRVWRWTKHLKMLHLSNRLSLVYSAIWLISRRNLSL